MTVILVALAGVAGVLTRYGLGIWLESIWTIAAINITGSFLLGLLTSAGGGLPGNIRTALGVGFIGGFTTLSTITAQTVLEADAGRSAIAATYLAVNVIGGLFAAATGYLVGRAIT